MNSDLADTNLSSAETLQHRSAGEMLFLEGQLAEGVYVLHSGEVDLLFSANGRFTPLRIATTGHILGLSALVMDQAHDCTATTRVPCEIGFIAGEKFLRRIDEHPALWFPVLRVLSSDVNSVYDDMRTLAAR